MSSVWLSCGERNCLRTHLSVAIDEHIGRLDISVDRFQLRVEKVKATKNASGDVGGDIVGDIDVDWGMGGGGVEGCVINRATAERSGRSGVMRFREAERGWDASMMTDVRFIRSLKEPASMYSIKILTQVWVAFRGGRRIRFV